MWWHLLHWRLNSEIKAFIKDNHWLDYVTGSGESAGETL
jgi:hypothetical protein